jgi:hypothetical protein
MSFNKFKLKPSDSDNYVKSYRHSIFTLPAAPEYSHGETCLASLMRNIGSKVSESDVYNEYSLEGSPLRNKVDELWNEFANSWGIGSSIYDLVKSPMPAGTKKNPNEYLNLYPLIPPFSFLSNSARYGKSPWNPGEYIKGMLASGCDSFEQYEKVWRNLFEVITIGEDDDVWSRILHKTFNNIEQVNKDIFGWRLQKLDKKTFDSFAIGPAASAIKASPASVLCNSIDRLKSLKHVTTRRQWVSIFESLLRVSVGSHVIWISTLNSRLWRILWHSSYSYKSELNNLFSKCEGLNIDGLTDPRLRTICGSYAQARIGINYLCHFMSCHHSIDPPNFNDFEDLKIWVDKVKEVLADEHVKEVVAKDMMQVCQKSHKLFLGKSGFSKNMFEFLRHSLGQKTTQDPEQRSFDQGFWCYKKGLAKASKWVTGFGPVSVIMIVALAIKRQSGTASEISEFLSNFGFFVNPDKLLDTTFGKSLVDLGLSSDNPDGERGAVIFNPFSKF